MHYVTKGAYTKECSVFKQVDACWASCCTNRYAAKVLLTQAGRQAEARKQTAGIQVDLQAHKQTDRGTDTQVDRQKLSIQQARRYSCRERTDRQADTQTDSFNVWTSAGDKRKPAIPCTIHSPSHQRLPTLLKQRC